MNGYPDGPLRSRERSWVFLLCLLASIHVFIFSAAFPFSNNNDEQAHLDLILKYSHAHLPRSLELFSKESAQYLAIYSTREYLGTPEFFVKGQFPRPLWKQPFESVRQDVLGEENLWLQQDNHESSQPPLYYAIMGAWHRVGRALGFEGGGLLYWLRFANCLFIALLVWIAYRTASLIFPESSFARLAVPALVAFLPQTAFYSLQNDVLSPVSFGLLFLLMIRFFQSDLKDVRLACWTGLAFAAVFLTKSSNLSLLGLVGVLFICKLVETVKAHGWGGTRGPLLGFAVAAVLPSFAWMLWMKLNFGDFTGSALKIQRLGWTHKPLSQWFHHPLFTPHGIWIFVSESFSSFWQGEFWWHRHPMASPLIGKFYALLSIGLIIVSAIKLWRSKPGLAPDAQKLWYALGCVIASFCFYAVLSLSFDFGDCPNPSREHPYFVSGRLMLGMLIPFLLLFVYGLRSMLQRQPVRVSWLSLGGFILFMLLSELGTNWPAFFSDFNWYHL